VAFDKINGYKEFKYIVTNPNRALLLLKILIPAIIVLQNISTVE